MRLLIPLLLLLATSAQAKWYSDTQDVMGTRVSVTFWLEDEAKAAEALVAVMAEMHRIDQHFSPYIASSELSRANQQAVLATAEKPLAISAELTRLIDKSLYYSRLTDGAFDITFASLARYYDYRKKLTPSEAQRAALLPAINYRLIHLDKQHRTLWFEHPQLYIDLGGIAKGYAVDRGIDILRGYGIAHASLSAGGDSRVLGDKRGRPWLVGIKNPRADAVAISLPLDNVSVSTSGDYERYFIADNGERVHHIINPRTGKSTSGVNSVTIIGPLGFDTDPLSTSVFVMGPEKGLALINQLPGFDAVIITSQGKVLYSQGLIDPE
ncbi:thiamine biosynthesis protein ApbE [Cellvibrio mixtus]|jgi:thiamine biosynthesis lipoprotein|uniref:FAD:protein FMN transferase n=1 Tax=Cellvibrio mixtus TaxID=39650 RepID=A0A266QDC5_9GAMM|nr:FAD:protein FMN transferase [Cellvibrio mixtus]OZY87800.1 thiamine biosynthesis protein ApbE [Cellvibrio mixtus]